MNKPLLSTLASIALGVLFVASGFSKANNTADFIQLIDSYGLPKLTWMAPYIAGLEVALGLALLLQVELKKMALASLSVLGIFTLSFAYGHLIHGVEDCGCFGGIEWLKMSPAMAYLRNLVLLGLSYWLWKAQPSMNAPVAYYRLGVIALLVAPTLIIAGYSVHQPYFPEKKDAKEVTAYRTGRPAVSIGLNRYHTISKDSTYLFFVFSYGCPHCWDAVENVKKYQETGTVDKVIGLAWYAQYKMSFLEKFDVNFPIIDINRDQLISLTDVVPTAFFVKDGLLLETMKATIPNPHTFRNSKPQYFYNK